MRHLRRLAILILVAAGGWALARLAAGPLARPALGYVAKVTCSQVFVGGLSPEAAVAELPSLGAIALEIWGRAIFRVYTPVEVRKIRRWVRMPSAAEACQSVENPGGKTCKAP